jgi:mevalonate kinase
MSRRVIVSKASAPGKAILFGEQAVVHGATAIAAALSDLRIEVDMVCKTEFFSPFSSLSFFLS